MKLGTPNLSGSVAPVAEMFTQAELEEIQERATELAQGDETDASTRTALQLLAEAAANVVPRVEEGS